MTATKSGVSSRTKGPPQRTRKKTRPRRNWKSPRVGRPKRRSRPRLASRQTTMAVKDCIEMERGRERGFDSLFCAPVKAGLHISRRFSPSWTIGTSPFLAWWTRTALLASSRRCRIASPECFATLAQMSPTHTDQSHSWNARRCSGVSLNRSTHGFSVVDRRRWDEAGRLSPQYCRWKSNLLQY